MNNKKVFVLGLSKSGIAAAKLAKKRGADVYLSEGREVSEENLYKVRELENLGIHLESGSHSDDFITGADLAITSPGIAPHSEIIQKLKSLNIPVISELEFGYLNTDKKFVTITGTNGKTTTTALTEHIFVESGLKAKACGNIGLPASEIVDEDLDWLVCEASSFQLDMTENFSSFAAIWTNFTPDHIDWHNGLENYFRAKTKAFRNAEFSILNAKDEKLLEYSKELLAEGKSTVFLFDGNIGDNCCYIENGEILYKENGVVESIIRLVDCPLIGAHNYQNIMCAVIASKLAGISNDLIKNAVMSFKAPAHRLERITEKDGITFYNDSKATNPEAAIVAIDSFNDTNVVLIAGGRDKNTDLAEFCESVKNHIETVILIGEATERFEENLIKYGFTNIIREETMQTAIDRAILLNPDVVLLSPACASFDMFTGYEQRGDVFREYVLSRV